MGTDDRFVVQTLEYREVVQLQLLDVGVRSDQSLVNVPELLDQAEGQVLQDVLGNDLDRLVLHGDLLQDRSVLPLLRKNLQGEQRLVLIFLPLLD